MKNKIEILKFILFCNVNMQLMGVKDNNHIYIYIGIYNVKVNFIIKFGTFK